MFSTIEDDRFASLMNVGGWFSIPCSYRRAKCKANRISVISGLMSYFSPDNLLSLVGWKQRMNKFTVLNTRGFKLKLRRTKIETSDIAFPSSHIVVVTEQSLLIG